MHVLVLVLLVAFPTCCLSFSLNQAWREWRVKHEKTYDEAEEDFRKALWMKNVEMIQTHNREAAAGKHSFSLGLNQLADMTVDEVNEKLNGLKPEEPSAATNVTLKNLPDLVVPQTVDWRARGLVSPVQNQGMCGSCWAFSAAGALEGQMKVRTGVLVPLSPQNLIDCSVRDGNRGCKGGYISKAYKYIIRNKGIDSEYFYPYEHKNGLCRYSVAGKAGHCSRFSVLPRGDERALQSVVASVGPVAVSVNANLRSFHLYRGGIYNDPECSPNALNHAVLLVGYGTDNGQDYWLVKNSWGASWGEGGYIKIARNKRNTCGIATFAVYPKI